MCRMIKTQVLNNRSHAEGLMMSERKITRNLIGLVLFIMVVWSGGCDGFLKNDCINCPVSTGNRSTNAIRFVGVISGTTTNEFGYLGGSKTNGKTSLGCEVELVPDLKIEWEEEDKKYTATVNTARYIPKRREIKSFSFLYLGKGKWDVIARSGIFNDSPEINL